MIVIGSLVFAHRFAPPDVKIRARAQGTPTVERHTAAGTRTESAFVGSGSWALSALPTCFDQQSMVRGPAAALAKNIPPAAARLASATRVPAGECVLIVGRGRLWITRGRDRLFVPPPAAIYRTGPLYTLVVRNGGTTEIRRYLLR